MISLRKRIAYPQQWILRRGADLAFLKFCTFCFASGQLDWAPKTIGIDDKFNTQRMGTAIIISPLSITMKSHLLIPSITCARLCEAMLEAFRLTHLALRASLSVEVPCSPQLEIEFRRGFLPMFGNPTSKPDELQFRDPVTATLELLINFTIELAEIAQSRVQPQIIAQFIGVCRSLHATHGLILVFTDTLRDLEIE